MSLKIEVRVLDALSNEDYADLLHELQQIPINIRQQEQLSEQEINTLVDELNTINIDASPEVFNVLDKSNNTNIHLTQIQQQSLGPYEQFVIYTITAATLEYVIPYIIRWVAKNARLVSARLRSPDGRWADLDDHEYVKDLFKDNK